MSDESTHARVDREMTRAMFAGYDSEELSPTMEAERDVLGSKAVGFVIPKDAADVAVAVKEMKEALASIPEQQNAVYLEACKRAHRNFEMEHPWRDFSRSVTLTIGQHQNDWYNIGTNEKTHFKIAFSSLSPSQIGRVSS